ncbi:MAG: substrate-binding domain-containing protein [Candidatus Syntropharchaeales archaeon]
MKAFVKKLKAQTKRLVKDTRAVSPAIASLVLVVIAVVGAAGVGMILTDVQEQSGDAGEKDLSVAGKLDVQGSTTVLPFALEAAKTYMDTHPAVSIAVSGGGSGHGKSMAKAGKIDIGMASSRAATEDILQEGEAGAVLYETEIGKRMIVVIVNDGTNANTWRVLIEGQASDLSNGVVGYDDIVDLYTNGSAGTGALAVAGYTAYERSDVSGTEEGFAKWLGVKNSEGQLNAHPDTVAVMGNPGVWAAVSDDSNAPCIGFVDLGYITDTTYAAEMDDNVNPPVAPTADNYDAYETASKTVATTTGKPLTSKLYYYTHGAPSGATKAFIDFCLSNEGQDILEDVGMIKL